MTNYVAGRRGFFFFQPQSTQGTTGMPEPKEQDKPQGTPPEDHALKTEPPKSDDKPKEDEPKPEPKYTEAEFQSEIDRRVTQALKKREEEHAAKIAAEKEAAEQKRLEEQGQWQEAAEKAKARAEELAQQQASAEARLQAAEQAVQEQVTALLAELKDDLRPVIEDALAGKSPTDQLSYLAKHRESLNKPDKPRGTPSLQKPDGTGAPTKQEIIRASARKVFG